MSRTTADACAARSASARDVMPAQGSHEHEADRAADVIAAGGNVTSWSFTSVPLSAAPIQRAASTGASPSWSAAALGIGPDPTGGRPIEGPTRRFMEQGFGQDFGAVRVHTDGAAAASATALGAHAYTSDDRITFAPGRYAPSTPGGRRLIAHELAHVVQQRRSAPGARPIQRYTAYPASDQAAGSTRGWRHPGGEDMRVSDDGQMAVDDKGWNPGTNKRAWTTPALMTASNGVLSAQGSRALLRPRPGGHAIAGTAPQGGANANLTEIEPYNSSGGHFSLASDCGTACRQILGSGPAGTKDVAVMRGAARPGSDGTGGAIAGGILGFLAGAGGGALLGSLAGPLGAIIGGIVGGIAGAIGGAALGRHLARRDPEEAHETYSTPRTYHGGNPTTPEEYSGELYQRELGGATREEALQRYAALSSGERDDFDRRHGINRYAQPHVGEGITIGTEYRMPGYADPGGNSWNFHYAAAVLESGTDYVTLESAAGWGLDDWIFYMYGPPSKQQSFQEEQADTGAHGTRQTSLVVRPERTLDVQTTAPGTTLRTPNGAVTLPAGQRLRTLERRTPTGGTEEVRVRVLDGPNAGAEGWVAARAIG